MNRSLIILTGITGTLIAETFCEEIPGVCNVEDCTPCYCLGPEIYAANPPTHPKICNGDWVVTISGFYWSSRQDGMEYALETEVAVPMINPSVDDLLELNNLIEGHFQTPNFKGDLGLRLGIGYNTQCDGWDIGVTWTRFRNFSPTHIEAHPENNKTLLTLLSAFNPAQGGPLYAFDISLTWRVSLDLVDFEIGREYWTSRYITLRPFIGLRYAKIDQDLDLKHKGGSWSPRTNPNQAAFTNEVKLDNEFEGVGLRGGISSVCNVGCGFGFYGNFATSIIYGRFNVAHDEQNRLAVLPYSETEIFKFKSFYKASRAILDLSLGIQYSSLFDEVIAVTGILAWENHLFFDQNQLWRTNRINSQQTQLPNNTGENVFTQKRGDLATQGWTLTLKLEF